MSRNTMGASAISQSGRGSSPAAGSLHGSRMPFTSSARGAALGLAVLIALAVVAIVLHFTVDGPFGALNDWLNAAVGVASAVLAAVVAVGSPDTVDRLAAPLGVGGGAVMAYGSSLVITDEAGWFQAGVVSGVGAGLVGVWLLALNRAGPGGDPPSAGVARLGRLAGGFMALGLLGLPGWVSGVDDWAAAPWYVQAGMVGWLGTYALYPAWCWRVSRLR